MIDEYDCPSGLTCENLEGSYTCTVACQPGTERTSDGKSCTDIDECQTDQHSCQQVRFIPQALCSNPHHSDAYRYIWSLHDNKLVVQLPVLNGNNRSKILGPHMREIKIIQNTDFYHQKVFNFCDSMIGFQRKIPSLREKYSRVSRIMSKNSNLTVVHRTAGRVPFCSCFKGYKIVQDVTSTRTSYNVYHRVVITLDKIFKKFKQFIVQLRI